jgi:hypothetical protein
MALLQFGASRTRSPKPAIIAIPGRVFPAKVLLVSDVISQGQVQAGGTLLNPEDRSKVAGRAITRLEITGDMSGYQLPEGSTAQVAVYTDHLAALAIIRRILLRMKAWLNYVI